MSKLRIFTWKTEYTAYLFITGIFANLVIGIVNGVMSDAGDRVDRYIRRTAFRQRPNDDDGIRRLCVVYCRRYRYMGDLVVRKNKARMMVFG